MASILCRKGETFPNSHRHGSVAEVRQCQGAPVDWKREHEKVTERALDRVKDPRNVYLNPNGISAQLAAFDGSELGVTVAEVTGNAERLTKELGELAPKAVDQSVPSRVDPELEAKIPAGRYAVPGDDGALKFYRVEKPTGRWAGRTFVSVQAGDDWHPMRYSQARAGVLRKIAADVMAAAVAYGRELGVCSQCGRTLTNPASIEAGIGPVCAGRL